MGQDYLHCFQTPNIVLLLQKHLKCLKTASSIPRNKSVPKCPYNVSYWLGIQRDELCTLPPINIKSPILDCSESHLGSAWSKITFSMKCRKNGYISDKEVSGITKMNIWKFVFMSCHQTQFKCGTAMLNPRYIVSIESSTKDKCFIIKIFTIDCHQSILAQDMLFSHIFQDALEHLARFQKNTMTIGKLLMYGSVCCSKYENHLLLYNNILTIAPAGCVIITLAQSKFVVALKQFTEIHLHFCIIAHYDCLKITCNSKS